MRAGEVYCVETPTRVLYVALTDIDKSGCLLMAPMSPFRTGLDSTCFVETDDYPLIAKRSVINYGAIVSVPGSVKVAVLRAPKGNAKVCEPVSDALLKRIQEGAIASKMTPREYKESVRRTLAAPR